MSKISPRDPLVDPMPGDVVRYGLVYTARLTVTRRTPKMVVLESASGYVERVHLFTFQMKARMVLHVAQS